MMTDNTENLEGLLPNISFDEILEHGNFVQILIAHVMNLSENQDARMAQINKVVDALYLRKEKYKKDLEDVTNSLFLNDIVNINDFKPFTHVSTSFEKLQCIFTDKIVKSIVYSDYFKKLTVDSYFDRKLKATINFFNTGNDNTGISSFLYPLDNRNVNLSVGSYKQPKNFLDLFNNPLFIIKKNFKDPYRLARKVATKMLDYENSGKDSIYDIKINDISGLTVIVLEPLLERKKKNLFNRIVNMIYDKKSKGEVEIVGKPKNFFKNPKRDENGLLSYCNAYHFVLRPHSYLGEERNRIEVQIHPISYFEYELGGLHTRSHISYENYEESLEKNFPNLKKKKYREIIKDMTTVLNLLVD